MIALSPSKALSTTTILSRRNLLLTAASLPVATASVAPAWAAADCLVDCLRNCKLLAPKDGAYCQDNCEAYCAQEDRNDGLSGSVSASGGEVGLLGGTFGSGTVPKGQDRPPAIKLPGLDFTSDSGKKLIGY